MGSIKILITAILSYGLLSVGGCILAPSNPAATQPATAIDAREAKPAYWMDQPAVVSVHGTDYERLWDATEQTARNFLFPIDRSDYRLGVLTTAPVTSKQFFEFWRDDTPTPHDLARSSLQTLRRSIRFDFTRDGTDGWEVWPRVLVEQYVSAGQQVAYIGTYTTMSSPAAQTGSAENDQGRYIPTSYWFAIGRDHALEKKLAAAIARQIK